MEMTNQGPVAQNPMVPGQIAEPSPIPSTTPEFEQILVKIQELEQRLGDLEMKGQTEEEEVSPAKFEAMLRKSFDSLKENLIKTIKEEIKGEPEIEKDKKDQKAGPESTDDVPKAQTSEIDEETGEKTGAPVAGEETGLDKGEPEEKKATKLVPKPESEYPKMTVSKNALDEHKEAPKGEPFIKKKYSDKPEPMKGAKPNTSDGMAEHYNNMMEKLSGRKSIVGATGESNLIRETYLGAKDSTNNVIKEYMRKSKVAF